MWHKRLGHISKTGLHELEIREVLGNKGLGNIEFYENCVFGKSTRSGLPDLLWAEATVTAAYVINRFPYTTLEKKTLMELWLDDVKPKIIISKYVVFNESLVYKDTLKGACVADSRKEARFEMELQGSSCYEGRDDFSKEESYLGVIRSTTWLEAGKLLQDSGIKGLMCIRSVIGSAASAMIVVFTSRSLHWGLLRKEFDMKELGPTRKILDMKFVRDRSIRTLKVSQSGYVQKFLNNYKVDNGKLVSMPLGAHFKVFGESRDQWKHMDVDGFVDADYAKDPKKGRSITGYVFIVHGFVLSWKATLQHVVILSTTEAKYMVLTKAVKESIWLKGLLIEMGINLRLVVMNCENQCAIHLSRNVMFYERAKHINVRYHFIREIMKSREIEVAKIGYSRLGNSTITQRTLRSHRSLVVPTFAQSVAPFVGPQQLVTFKPSLVTVKITHHFFRHDKRERNYTTTGQTFVKANYEALESLLRDRRRQMCNNDLRTELGIRRWGERTVGFEGAQSRGESRVERNTEEGRTLKETPRGNGGQSVNLPSLLVAHLGSGENGQPLQSYLTSAYGGQVLPSNIGGNIPSNDELKMPSHIGSYDGKEDLDNFLHLFERAIQMKKWLMLVACHMFTYTLKDFARIWWNSQKADLPSTYKCLMEKTYTWVEAREVATNGASSDQRDSFERSKKICQKSEGNSRYGEGCKKLRATSKDVRKGKIFGRKVGRVYMDSEDSYEIIYEHYFEKLNPTIKATKVDLKTPLVRFSGERSWSIGEVPLEITIRDSPLLRTETLNFFIVRSDSSHNMLLGRIAMQRMGIVVSMIHRAIKFHTKKDSELYFRQTKLMKERRGPERYLPQIRKGSSVVSTLRKNYWISRTIMVKGKPFNTEHKLNEYSHVKPIKQNKRGLSPDRNMAAFKEIEERTKVGILWKVKHQTWVANPVMGFVKYFLDAYRRYHQIQMADKTKTKQPSTQENESFATRRCRLVSKMQGQHTKANFLVEIPFEDNKKKEKPKDVPYSNSKWRLYTNGASNSDGSRAGLMLIDPEGLRIAQEIEISKVAIFLDSQLLNKTAGALSKLASMTFEHLTKEVLVEVLTKRSMEEKEVLKKETPFSLIYGLEAAIPLIEATDDKGRVQKATKGKESKEMASIEKVPKGNLLVKVAQCICPQLKATHEPSLTKHIKEADLSPPKTSNTRKSNRVPKRNLLVKVTHYICPQLKATHEPSLIKRIKESDLSPSKTSNMRKTNQVPKGSLPSKKAQNI
uniref:Putative transposable element n=1 Tax=Tanacetum cinerariifolium TaxID=118510 RepID=A0A6L2MLF0_TANCI|nr:putative transposable element [Tanacetum cinerariifolium]